MIGVFTQPVIACWFDLLLLVSPIERITTLLYQLVCYGCIHPASHFWIGHVHFWYTFRPSCAWFKAESSLAHFPLYAVSRTRSLNQSAKLIEPMKNYIIDHGLIVDNSTTPPTCCGYLMDFHQHGIFSPDGKVSFTKEQADTHNALLAQAELAGSVQHGRAVWYLINRDGKNYVGQWVGKSWPVSFSKTSWHNMAGRDGRTDVWFTGPDGRNWHGVNIGDNQICRCRRVKS